MAKVARFKSAEARENFLALYDRAVDELWPVPSEELDVPTGYGTTRVRRCGAASGWPLVLLHGNSGTSVGWAFMIERLSQSHEVLSVDVIGTLGRSVQTQPLEQPEDLAEWFRDVLDGLGIERAHVIGFSEGGFVAFHVALGNQDRVASLVAIDAAGTVERIRIRFWISILGAIIKVAVRGPKALREFGERMIPGVVLPDLQWELMTTGAKGFKPGLPMPRRMSEDQLRRLATPTLLYMAGASEVYDPKKAALRGRALLPDVEIVIVEGAQHGLPLTHPERTWSDVLAFVDRHDRSARPYE